MLCNSNAYSCAAAFRPLPLNESSALSVGLIGKVVHCAAYRLVSSLCATALVAAAV